MSCPVDKTELSSKEIAEKIEYAIEHNLRYAMKLRYSILKAAFEGKLVPQDQNDEPAEILLQRIKQNKAKSEIHSNPKKTKIKHDEKQMRLF